MSDTPPGSPPKREEDVDPPGPNANETVLDRVLRTTTMPASVARVAEKAAEAEDAVDDTEDLVSDDVVEAKRKSGSYGRRKSVSKSKSTRFRSRGPSNDKFAKVQTLLPFSFHPNVRPLTISDLESCIKLEEAAFSDPEHRCTREKFEYRLTACPELCLGVFCTVVPSEVEDMDFDLVTLPTAHPVETGRKDGSKSVLLAHIVATRSNDEVVTDRAMDYPRDWREPKSSRDKSNLGHQEEGDLVCIHSLAVHPKLQGCGLGKLIMMAYLQQLRNAKTTNWCALICQDYLVNYYLRFHFKHRGPSEATFGGGGWHDMVIDMADVPSYLGAFQARR